VAGIGQNFHIRAFFLGFGEEKMTFVCEKTISNVIFFLFEFSCGHRNVKEIIASLFDFLKE